MSLINGIIPPQSFELVRDKIGAILAIEFDRQVVLTGDYDLDVEVWVERFIPFDRKELPSVNVMFAAGEYDGETVKQADGTYAYFVDFHTRAKTTVDDRADQKSLYQLHRLMGVARAIIMNPRYKSLGFADPFVMWRRVKSIDVQNPDPSNADSVAMGRLKVMVKVPETTELLDTLALTGNDTTVQLDLTEKGYRYTFYD